MRGGVQRHSLSLAHALENLGHKVKLYTFIYKPQDCYAELMRGLEVVSLDYLPQPPRLRFLGYVNYFIGLNKEAAAAKKLASLIDRDTDILNPHDHVCYKTAYFFKRRIKNIPSVWTMHDMPTKTFSLLREKELNPDFAVSPLKRFFYWLADKYDIGKYIKNQNRIAVLDSRDQKWVKDFFGLEATIIRNGLNINDFPHRARESSRGRRCRLFMNGIFMPHRRFEDGVRAVKILRDTGYEVSAEIAGDYGIDNQYYDKLSKLVSELGLSDRIRFLGLLSETDLVKKYKESDIFLFPNHLQSWGLAVFEAMATGLPVIVSKSAGASEVLTHRKNAMIVQPKRPDEFASAIAELIENSDLYRALNTAGRRFAEEEISWSRTARMMDEIFACLCETSKT